MRTRPISFAFALVTASAVAWEPPAPPTPQPTSAPIAFSTTEEMPAKLVEATGPVNLDCSLALSDPIQLRKKLTMRQVVNQQDGSVTVQLVLKDDAWIGFAFSSTGGMVPSTAVIGVPGKGVGLYFLGSRSPYGVKMLPESEQKRLSDASIVQEDDETVLTFTLAVGSDGQALKNADGRAARIIYAWGFGNALGYHRFRSFADIVFGNCVEVPPVEVPPVEVPPVEVPPVEVPPVEVPPVEVPPVEVPPVEVPPVEVPPVEVPPAEVPPAEVPPAEVPPVEVPPVEVPPVELDCSLTVSDPIPLEKDVILRQVVNQQDGSVTIQLILFAEAWIGFAFSSTGEMVPATAAIGTPGDGVGLYGLGDRSLEGVKLLPEAEQTRLSDVSIVQGAGETVLTFTLAVGSDEKALATGGETSRIIYAYGSSNTLGFHKFRSSAEVVFTNCFEKS